MDDDFAADSNSDCTRLSSSSSGTITCSTFCDPDILSESFFAEELFEVVKATRPCLVRGVVCDESRLTSILGISSVSSVCLVDFECPRLFSELTEFSLVGDDTFGVLNPFADEVEADIVLTFVDIDVFGWVDGA